MLPDRRTFMSLVVGAAACPWGGAARAETDRALFWRIEAGDNAAGTVFGYARTAASVSADVVRDGVRLVEQSRRVVLDMDNVKFPPVTTTEHMPPLLPMLSRPVADELRKALAALAVPQSQIDDMPGVLIAMSLYGEGQTKPVPSVGGVIMDRAKALHLPVTTLLATNEVEKFRKPLDLVTLNKAVDEKLIAFMLDVRRQVGPIGKHCEDLYRERRAEELHAFARSMSEHGVPESQIFFEGETIRELLLTRLTAALSSQAAAAPAFCFLPIGVVSGPEGLLATSRRRGMRASALA
jgi:hypothetical protein